VVIYITAKADTAPKMQVKCHVDTCYYYKNNLCHATALEVNPMGDRKAQTSEGTCCSTFIKTNDAQTYTAGM
jgi:hypothetical protein